MPEVQKLYSQELESAGINIVGVSQFNTTEPETVAFVERFGLSFPNIYDQQAQLASTYGVNGVPSYVFLDKQGRIAHTSSGARGVLIIKTLLNTLDDE